jgi:LppP/LprE lipoprotein
VLFFDRNSPIGTPTPDPRPYITNTAMGNDTAAVQYQWRQGQDPACCPTGIATVRFKVEDGKLKALDPIPNPCSHRLQKCIDESALCGLQWRAVSIRPADVCRN